MTRKGNKNLKESCDADKQVQKKERRKKNVNHPINTEGEKESEVGKAGKSKKKHIQN